MKLGPNMTRLIVTFCSTRAVPKGGGLEDGISWLLDPERMARDWQESTNEAFEAVEILRNAGLIGDDEYIAGELLRRAIEKNESSPNFLLEKC